MKLKLAVGVFCIVALVAQASFAVVVGGDDLDGGLTFSSRVLVPDNTANNGEWPMGNERDYFGIGSVDINDDGSCAASGACDLNPQLIDESLWDDPGDQSGVILATDTDNKFLIADLEGGHNATSPNGTGTWTFDISGFNNLSIGIEMAQIGGFGKEDRGMGEIVNDRFNWSYQIDGEAVQPLFNVQAANSGVGDGAGWVANMADGNSYLAGDFNFFFDDGAEGWPLLECTLGVTNSCMSEVTNTFGDILRPAQLDENEDGYIYLDVSQSSISDTPTRGGDYDGNGFVGAGDLSLVLGAWGTNNYGVDWVVQVPPGNTVGAAELQGVLENWGTIPDLLLDAMMIYEEENFFSEGCGAGGFDCFQQAERNLFINPLLVNDAEALNNELREFLADVIGTGSELTLFFDAENYGGARFFVFDNIVVNGDAALVPEPSSVVLLLFGLAMLARRRK